MWNVLFAGIPVKRWAAYGSLLLAGTFSPVRVGIVTGDSMAPSLHSGQPYLYAPPAVTGPVKRGDVVLFRHNDGVFVKRVLAGPGDSVHVLRYNDGVDEVIPAWKLRHFEKHGRAPWMAHFHLEKFQVPADKVYVVGDHLSNSVDSRSFGPVSLSQIQGRVLFAPPPVRDWESLATEAAPPRS